MSSDCAANAAVITYYEHYWVVSNSAVDCVKRLYSEVCCIHVKTFITRIKNVQKMHFYEEKIYKTSQKPFENRFDQLQNY